MNEQNRLPADDTLQAQADKTWESLEQGEQLGVAIRDALQEQLPEADAGLREQLVERLAESEPGTKVEKEAKWSSVNGTRSSRPWILAICTLVMAGGAVWWASTPISHQFRSARQATGEDEMFADQSLASGFVNIEAALESESQSVMTVDNGSAQRQSLSFYVTPEIVSAGEDRRSDILDFPVTDTFEFRPATDSLQLDQSVMDEATSGEQYNQIHENQFLPTRGDLAVSTFSIDVDTAAYANVRRFLNSGQRPPRDAVRIEELINYFNYDYPQPEGDVPFSVNMELADCPWHDGHQLLRVGLQGKEIHRDERPVSNLVFLLDVSGSMNHPDKLPLLKRALRMMVDRLNENDQISIVTYAGNAGVVLSPTSGDQKPRIHAAIQALGAGGSTHGSAGIESAYNLATRNFIQDGVNRVIWATDGDLNVGITDDATLKNLVAERAKEGVFLTTLGFGTGNLKDGKLEQIANNGNGIYAYIDSMREARKVLIEQMSASLVTIAKDVKLQIEFNPAQVQAYRLVGYENRMLATEDFDNDEKDAGEIGAGHSVTAIYEIVPVQVGHDHAASPTSPNLKYQAPAEVKEQESIADDTNLSAAAKSGELLTLALRYKQPDEEVSSKIDFTLGSESKPFDEASSDFRFAASVAGFGMLLRQSRFRGNVTAEMIEQLAGGALGEDASGYRAEFLDLVRRIR